jgi:hypothetical protein
MAPAKIPCGLNAGVDWFETGLGFRAVMHAASRITEHLGLPLANAGDRVGHPGVKHLLHHDANHLAQMMGVAIHASGRAWPALAEGVDEEHMVAHTSVGRPRDHDRAGLPA